MDFGELIRNERQRLGLTQQQLADKATVGLNFVYQLEKNKETVRMDCVTRVLEAVGFELSVRRHRDPWVKPVDSQRAGAFLA